MLSKSEPYTISQNSIRRLHYYIFTILIIISTLVHIARLFTSETWFIVQQDGSNGTIVYFQSENICLEHNNTKFCMEPYLPMNPCNEHDLVQWTIRCSSKHLIHLNKTSSDVCHCVKIPLTNIINRNNILIFILLILTSLITLSKFCSSKECILYYFNKYLLCILLISIISFEIHLIYIIFNDKNLISQLFNNSFSMINISLTKFYSFQIFIIIIHIISIIILISC